MPSTMQAIVKAHAAPGIELREVPVPVPGPGEVLVRVLAASVCGTDLHIYNWDPWAQGRIHPPLIPGHEFSGVVAGVGPRRDHGQGRRPGERGDARGLRQVPAMPHRRGAHLPARAHPGRGRRRRLRQLRHYSGEQHLEALAVDSARLCLAARSAGQRGAYRAGRAHRRADRGGDRLRRHRPVFDCRGQGLRSGQGLRHRGECAPPGGGNDDGRGPGAGPSTDNVEEQILEATGGTGVDVLLEMSGHPGGHAAGLCAAADRRPRLAAGDSVAALRDWTLPATSSSRAPPCRASTAARCSRPGSRWRRCWPPAS